MIAALVVAPPAFSEPSLIADRCWLTIERELKQSVLARGPGFLSTPAIRSSNAVIIDELFRPGWYDLPQRAAIW